MGTLTQVLRDIRDGKTTRKTAAEILGISERHVNRLMKAQGVTRPRGRRAIQDAQAQARKRLLATLADQVVQGQLSIDAAASVGDCSPRTIYRWVKRAANDYVRK